jgi:uncharacterized protein
MLRKKLQVILDIQELDIQMIRLMRLKREREGELARLRSLKTDLNRQVLIKEGEIIELKKQMRISECDLTELKGKITKLESQQNSVKKVEEFNALTHEISTSERDKTQREQKLSDLYDKLAIEEDLLKTLKGSAETTKTDSEIIEKEILESIVAINKEGADLNKRREGLVKDVDVQIFSIYEKLLKNRRDRIVVPIENRCCSGCHILVTAQHENIVRKGDKLVFCEHCSRIHYWDKEEVSTEETKEKPARRRRKVAAH